MPTIFEIKNKDKLRTKAKYDLQDSNCLCFKGKFMFFGEYHEEIFRKESIKQEICRKIGTVPDRGSRGSFTGTECACWCRE